MHLQFGYMDPQGNEGIYGLGLSSDYRQVLVAEGEPWAGTEIASSSGVRAPELSEVSEGSQ